MIHTPDIKQHTFVDHQLMEQGAFTPLEWLFNNGCLLYCDYESWRLGEFEYLDTRLRGDHEQILGQIKEAVNYVIAIGLVAQEQIYSPWNNDKADGAATLRISAEDGIHELLAQRYMSTRDVSQMDMFIDNPIVVLTNDLRAALGNRNLTEAAVLLGRLHERSPNHAELARFDHLHTSLRGLESPITDVKEELRNMQQVDPVAKHLLGAQSRDYLTPLWQHLATALEGMAYNRDEPELHVSYALLQIKECKGAIGSVLNESQWQTQLPLCLRLTEAAYFVGDHTLSISAWCHICWLNPQQAVEILDAGDQTDPIMGRWWHRFLDTEELLSIDDQSPVTDFPAWLLITEPGLVHQLPEKLPTGNSAGERIYTLVHQLMHARHKSNETLEIELRKSLYKVHPDLFQYLKSCIRVVSDSKNHVSGY